MDESDSKRPRLAPGIGALISSMAARGVIRAPGLPPPELPTVVSLATATKHIKAVSSKPGKQLAMDFVQASKVRVLRGN